MSPDRPILHLSGPKLRAAFEQLLGAADQLGGIERFAGAVRLRAEIIRDRIRDGRSLDRASFEEIVPLLPTVRRRIAPVLAAGWSPVQSAIVHLIDDAVVPGTADKKLAAFETALSAPARASGSPSAPSTRVLRDLGAELLHACYPEHHPLMTRWVWDARTNTGVLREIWHDQRSGSDNVDHVLIDVPDRHETFIVLREELSQFLADNGIFRDMLWYVDLLQAQVYAIYISAQGGAYLKADFLADADALEHTRRILGLDRKAIGRAP